MIITFPMFLLKQSSLSAVIFSISNISFVAFVSILHSRIVWRRDFCSYQVTWCELWCIGQATLCIQQKSDESASCVQQNDVQKELKYADEFKSLHAMFVNCDINDSEGEIMCLGENSRN